MHKLKSSLFFILTSILFQAYAENTVAVVPFAGTDTSAKTLARGIQISERLSSFFAQSKFVVVVERIQIDKAFREIGLGQTGVINEESAAKTGKTIGATYIVVGSFSFEGAVETIQARIVNTETGVIVASVIKEGIQEPQIIDAIGIKLLEQFDVKTSYNQSFIIKRGFSWVVGTAALGCGGAAFWSHLMFVEADKKYKSAIQVPPNEFATLANSAQTYSNERIYFAVGSAVLLGTSIYLFASNKSEWKFERKKPIQGSFVPVITPYSVGLYCSINFDFFTLKGL